MASPLQAAIDHIIMAATELDIVTSLAKEGEEIECYSSAARVLRQLATGLIPEQPYWPESKVITLEIEKRKRRK